jgi:hypothetical protein
MRDLKRALRMVSSSWSGMFTRAGHSSTRALLSNCALEHLAGFAIDPGEELRPTQRRLKLTLGGGVWFREATLNL